VVSSFDRPPPRELGLPEPFRCDVHAADGSARVVPAGELDTSTAPVVHARVRAAIEDGCRHLTVDLSRLEFIDSSGVHLLLSWLDASRADGFQMTVVPGPARVQRVFELLGLTETLPFDGAG
jgi:anti-anti-sigma factor